LTGGRGLVIRARGLILKVGLGLVPCLPAAIWATSVTGEVYDVRTGEVIPRAKVKLGGEATTGGADGIFKIVAAPRKKSQIVATAPGYAVTVMPYLPVSPGPREFWQNVPLMPERTVGPYDGDFVDLFFRNAPLDEGFDGTLTARRFDQLPLTVRVVGGARSSQGEIARTVKALDEKWGLSIFELAREEEGAVELDFAAGAGPARFEDEGGRPRAFFPQGAPDENINLAEAFLRRIVLAGRLERVGVTEESLRKDLPLGEDLDAIVEIIYREPGDFDYGIFRRRPPVPVSILTDFYLGVGGYDRHGIRDEAGRPVKFPAEYQLGQVALAGGGSYRNVWVKAGFWFAGIWDVNAEELFVVPGGRAPEKVLRRNFSSYYRGGYSLTPAVGVRVGPLVGYRKLSIRGKFKESADPAGTSAPLDLDYTTRYDGVEAGFGGDVAFQRYKLGLFGEYARVFSNPGYNILEFGFGAVSAVGSGTFAFARIYWGQPMKYTFGGLAMKLAVPL
jgi:hypothetical protein